MTYNVFVGEEMIPFDDGNTALRWAEIAATKGKEVVVTIVHEEEPTKDIVCCPDCKNYYSYINSAGRLVQQCTAHAIDVYGDFYCAEGVLNAKEEK